MRIFLGVDGGSSKTHAALVDERGALLGFGRAGIANQHTYGLEKALEQVVIAVRMALEAAGRTPQDVELGCFCLAGADFSEDFRILETALEGLGLARKLVVKNDTAAGLRSGLSRPWGVVVVCGTGFNAAGRGRDGTEIGLPAHGAMTGDWGGGGTLGVEALGAVMRAWDGRGRPTLLTRLVLDALGLSREEDVLAELFYKRISRENLVDLTPLLFEAAEAGDEVARDLVIRMGAEAGLTANVFLKRLGLQDTDAEVVLAGSIFKGKGPLLVETVTQIVHAVSPRVRIVRPVLAPVAGAALLALELSDVEVSAAMMKAMETGPLALS